jgi:hypothetical protein
MGKMKTKKNYYMWFENQYVPETVPEQKDFTNDEINNILKEIANSPIVFTEPVEKFRMNLQVEISKEIADFLKQVCDIERINFGEDTYILNKIRFKIWKE